MDPHRFAYGGLTLSAARSHALWLRSGPARAAPKHHISAALPRQIRFGLFPFRSPLLGKSLLISLPRGTKMLQFPRFDLRPEGGVRIAQDSHSEISGSTGACTYPELIAACHVLHLSSSRAILLLPSLHRHYQPHITRLCAMIIARPPCEGGRLHPSYATFMAHCIRCCAKTRRRRQRPPRGTAGGAPFVHPPTTVRCVTKEVIRPQVPLRSPCYDFSLVAYLKFDNAN